VVAFEVPSAFCSFYNVTRSFMGFCMNQFFRDITVLGSHNIPKTGPVIFCGNHNNQFMDGCILLKEAIREVRFMVAAKSMRRPVLKQLFEGGKSIPVERAQDHAKPGIGKITFLSEFKVHGIDTKFSI
jgi:glycerol-3-phosphate O-acyltransferase/dihydroxyacetone phosphate acyltransferase